MSKNIRAEIYTDDLFKANKGGKIKRDSSPELDKILGIPYKCLDKGFIRVTNYMGNEDTIVNAARVSYGKGTKKSSENKGLINYLLAHAHTSPFEMCSITFHCKMPIFVARQWIRHRTAKVNEYSGRYSLPKGDFYVPSPERVQLQSSVNKQGSAGTASEDVQRSFIELCEDTNYDAMVGYERFNAEELSRELNRINMPLSNYTEWYWKIDLHNLMHFLRLREDSHAQWEIQAYGIVMSDIVEAWMPNVHASYVNHIRDAVKLSASEMKVVKDLLDACDIDVGNILSHHTEDKEFLERNNVSKRELTKIIDIFKD